MIKLIALSLFITLLFSCSANKKMKAPDESNATNEVPACLQSIIDSMAAESNGLPQSVSSYTYKNQTVYYLLSPCCDKYNVVYDSNCDILGYPDGGFTGKGDGKMVDFAHEATDKKIVWTKE